MIYKKAGSIYTPRLRFSLKRSYARKTQSSVCCDTIFDTLRECKVENAFLPEGKNSIPFSCRVYMIVSQIQFSIYRLKIQSFLIE